MRYLNIILSAITVLILGCSTAKKKSTNYYSIIAYKLTDRINTDGEIYVLRNHLDNCSVDIKKTDHFKGFMEYLNFKHPELSKLNWNKKGCDGFEWEQDKLQENLKLANANDLEKDMLFEFSIYEVFIAQDYVLEIWSDDNESYFYRLYILKESNVKHVTSFEYPVGYVEGEIKRETIYIDDK